MINKQQLLDIGLVCENEFLDKYIDLINNNLETKKEKYKTLKHHIIPRYYFKNNGLDIDNSTNNIVNLNIKDHILAHYYLARCSNKNYYGYSMGAIYYILNNKLVLDKNSLEEFISSLDDYDLYYKLYRDLIAESLKNPETSKKKHDSILLYIADMKENHASEWEARNKNISEKLTGREFTAEHKAKLSKLASERTKDKNSFYNHKHSEKTKESIGNKNSKKVIMISDLEEVEFSSMKKCLEYLKSIGIITTMNPIKKAIKNNQLIYGAYWKIIDNGHKAPNYTVESKLKLINTASERGGYKVLLIDGETIQSFNSLNKAALYILENNLDSIHPKNIGIKIQNAAKNDEYLYGFKWNVIKV